jgi:hypothetical protein
VWQVERTRQPCLGAEACRLRVCAGVVDRRCTSPNRLRGPRTATFPHQHEPAQVRHVRPGKVVERGPLSASAGEPVKYSRHKLARCSEPARRQALPTALDRTRRHPATTANGTDGILTGSRYHEIEGRRDHWGSSATMVQPIPIEAPAPCSAASEPSWEEGRDHPIGRPPLTRCLRKRPSHHYRTPAASHSNDVSHRPATSGPGCHRTSCPKTAPRRRETSRPRDCRTLLRLRRQGRR